MNQPSEKQLSDWPSRQLRKPPLLQTFLRRIPITIYLPNLSERSILEKKRNYREALFKLKAKRLEKKNSGQLAGNVIFSLHTIYSGNIGEIENAIKYVCGSAISQNVTSDEVHVSIRDTARTNVYASSK